jgi:hypothetical protein
MNSRFSKQEKQTDEILAILRNQSEILKSHAARLAATDKRFDSVEVRFGAVDKRFDSIEVRFDAVDKRFDAMEARFDAVDKRFDAMEARFDAVDKRFDAVEARLEAIEKRFDGLEERLTARIDKGVEEMKALFHQALLRMDEQNLRNRQAYDGYIMVYEKVQNLESRLKPECFKD